MDNNFENKEEAVDFLLTELSNKRQKEKWAKTLGGNPRMKAKKRKWIFVIATCLLMLVGAYFVNEYFSETNVVPDHQHMASNMISNADLEIGVTTRGTATENTTQEMLMNALANKNYAKAKEIYSSIGEKMTAMDKYNYAVLLSQDAEPDQDLIISLTKELIETNSEYAADALWVRAALYIQLGEIDPARKDLLSLKSYQFKTNRVNKILQSLK